jgi:hypothetical protein
VVDLVPPEHSPILILKLTVFFEPAPQRDYRRWIQQIDQSMAIVVETAQYPNRTNFTLESKARKLDGSLVGF